MIEAKASSPLPSPPEDPEEESRMKSTTGIYEMGSKKNERSPAFFQSAALVTVE